MTVAIYVRLSLEDGTEQESASIGNQRLLLLDFIRNSPDLYGAKVVEFSDDGYSGKNFDRPGVQTLLKAAFGGEVQCILVKDISRFGRLYHGRKLHHPCVSVQGSAFYRCQRQF